MKIELKYIRAESGSEVDRWNAHITDIDKNEFTIIELCKVEYEAFLFLQSQLKELSKLNGSFPDGLGDYDWKIIENYNSKNFRITELESQLKKAKDESEGLVVQMRAQTKAINELQEENEHFRNYASHTQFCSWLNNGNASCDCGYIKTQIEK